MFYAKRFFAVVFTCSLLFFNSLSLKAETTSELNKTDVTEKIANDRADPDAANWDIDDLDTAKDIEYLVGIEKDVILEMNKARSDPKKYAELYIRPKLEYFIGKNYSAPGQITIATKEGKTAVNNCINSMLKMPTVGLLTPELGMSLAAKDHVNDQSKTGKTGHTGSDKSSPFKRMERYGSWDTLAGENLAYWYSTGREIIVALLVDDGVTSRGHRTNIMNKSFSKTGVSVGTHPRYGLMCAIEYAAKHTSN